MRKVIMYMKSLPPLAVFFICWLSVFGWSFHAYFLEAPPSQEVTPSPSPSPAKTSGNVNGDNVASEQTLPWKDYQEALKAEREVLQQQAKDNLDRLDKLQDRIFGIITLLGGLILGFIYFLFGQTRKEVQSQLTEQISNTVGARVAQDIEQKINAQIDPLLKEKLAKQKEDLETMHTQMMSLQGKLQALEGDVQQMSSYKDREVVWFFSGDKNTAPNEIAALESSGFTITQPDIKNGEPFELGKPDLVIFSYDKKDETGEATRRLKIIAGLMKKNIPNVWLLIHTQSDGIGPDEKSILDGIWYVPTNFSATLLVNAQALIRRRSKY